MKVLISMVLWKKSGIAYKWLNLFSLFSLFNRLVRQSRWLQESHYWAYFAVLLFQLSYFASIQVFSFINPLWRWMFYWQTYYWVSSYLFDCWVCCSFCHRWAMPYLLLSSRQSWEPLAFSALARSPQETLVFFPLVTTYWTLQWCFS